ncbi:WD40 repeat-like protein [Trametes sanguinea]|nr:WD40 repeat-like protein [Trametes sanguinea]
MPALNALLGLGSPVRTRTMQTTGKTQSTGHQAHLTPTPGRSSRLELFQTGINRLIQALHIIKGYSSACPQLETAVGALLIALEAYNKYSDVMEALDVLLTRMEPLQDLIRKALEAGYDKCPKALRDRLEAFASKVQSVADDANALRSRRLIVRFINASDYAAKIEAWVKKLSWHIQSFILEGTIALELTVHEGFTEMEGRFDRLDHGIKLANEGISGLRDDFDHKLADDPLRTRLRPVIQARFDHASSVHVECHEGTREEVLATLCSWLRPDDPRLSSLPAPVAAADPTRPILWVYALPGVGKSTIALTTAGFWYEDKVLGATFFCASSDGERSNVVAIFRTLAYQLAQRFPKYREALTKVLDEDPDLPFASPSRQLEKLIAEPVQVAEKKGAFKGRVPIIIDALDECRDPAAVSTVLLSLALHIAKLGPLWILITSRLQENITRGFRQQALLANTQQLNLTDIPQDLTKRDIATFVRSRFEDIKRDYSHLPLPSDWPPPLQLTQLLTLADVLFIYASTAMRFVGDEKERSPQDQLDRLLKFRNAAATPGTQSILDHLYEEVLEDAIEQLGKDQQDTLPRLLLGTLVLAEERLAPTTLAALIDVPTNVVKGTLPAFHAVLTTSAAAEDENPIRMIHLSFTNFLVDPSRCTNKTVLVNPRIHHAFIALRCLKLMQESLKYNICEVPPKHHHLPNNEVPDLPARIAQRFPPALEYACRYWMHHLGSADIGEELLLALEEFCNTRLLYWLEALSLLGCVEIAVEALRSTQLLLKVHIRCLPLLRCSTHPKRAQQNASLGEIQVPALLYDCERIVQAFYPVISMSFMEIYRTAIPYSHIDSPLRRGHLAEVCQSVEVSLGLEKTWSTTLASRPIGFGTIQALSFSPDGTHVACATMEGPVLLLNVHTGAQLHVFEGHTDVARRVAFSPTGHEILSCSLDKTVRLWDVATGACLHTWTDHHDKVASIAWSTDGLLVSSGAHRGVIILRKVSLPERTVVFRNWNSVRVHALAFAADGDLVSGFGDKTCMIWDAKNIDWDAEVYAPRHTLTHSSEVLEVAVSLDSCLVACGLDSGEIVVWSKSDGEQLRSLHASVRFLRIISLAFHAENRLAAAYMTPFFLVWDISTATRLDILDNTLATASAFSSDGIHIAHAVGNTVHIRRWGGHELRQSGPTTTAQSSLATRLKRHLRSHSPAPLRTPTMRARQVMDDTVTRLVAAAVSPTGALILAVYKDQWRLWDVSNGRPVCMRSAEHRAFDHSVVSWSPSGELFTCTGKRNVVSVWDTQTGQRVRTFAGHSDMVTAVVFTADEQHVLSASGDGSIRRWDVRSAPRGAFSVVLCWQADGDMHITALAVSSDGRCMLSGSIRCDSPPDTSSADLLTRPSREPEEYGDCYHALRLHDATGRVVWIENHHRSICSVALSEDCSRALAGDWDGHVFLYDLTQLIPPDKSGPRASQPLAVPEHQLSSGSTRPVWHVSFSLDDQAIVTERSYIALSPELQPLLKRAAPVSWSPSYFLTDDGWLWRVDLKLNHRRIRWVPPSFRPHHEDFARTWSSTQGHGIACRTSDGRLVVLDVSQY